MDKYKSWYQFNTVEDLQRIKEEFPLTEINEDPISWEIELRIKLENTPWCYWDKWNLSYINAVVSEILNIARNAQKRDSNSK